MELSQLYQLQEHTLGVSSLAYDEKKGILYSGSLDKTIKMWDLNINKENCIGTPKLLNSINAHKKWITDIIFIKKYSTLFSSSLDKTIKIWENKANTLYCDLYLESHLDYVQKLFYLEKSNQLISTGFDYQIIFWDLKDFHILSSIDEYNSPVFSISCTENESTLFLGTFNSKIILWDLEINEEKMFLRGGGPIMGLKFISSQNLLVGIDNYGGLFGWDINNVKLLFSKQLKEPLNSLEIFQSDGKFFLILGGTNLYIYSISPFQEIFKTPAHEDKIESIKLIKIEQHKTQTSKYYIISGSLDKTIKIWQLKKV